MRIKVDTSNYTDMTKPVDAGWYPSVIKSCEEKKADGGEYPYLNMRFEITDGPFAGRAVFARLTTNPEKSDGGNSKNFMLVDLCKHLDIDTEDEVTENDFINKEIDIKVVVESQDSKDPESDKRNEVRKFRPVS